MLFGDGGGDADVNSGKSYRDDCNDCIGVLKYILLEQNTFTLGT
jgi:hypothetical protein